MRPQKNGAESPNIPWFKTYTTTYKAETSHLSFAEKGVYMALLVLAWETPGCSFPIDAKWIKRRLNIRSEAEFGLCETVLAEFWQIKDGRFFNERLTAEYEASVARYKAVRKGGAANAKRIAEQNRQKCAEKNKSLKTNKKESSCSLSSAIAEGKLRASNSNSNSSTPVTSLGRGEGSGEGGAAPPAKAGPSMDEMFDQWWAVYPKRTDKADARKAFAKAVEQDGFEVIMAGTEKYADHHKRAATPRKYLKGPAAWLRAGKQHDEYEHQPSRSELLYAAVFGRAGLSEAMDQQPGAEAKRGGSESRAAGDFIEGEWETLG